MDAVSQRASAAPLAPTLPIAAPPVPSLGMPPESSSLNRRACRMPRRPQAEIPSVVGVLFMDTDGKRIVAKYFKNHFASATEELAFEKKLADKTMRTNAKTEGARA